MGISNFANFHLKRKRKTFICKICQKLNIFIFDTTLDYLTHLKTLSKQIFDG